jgi:hypothetical protein
MAPSTVNPLHEPFMSTADAVARERPEVDLDLAREVFDEAATMLHNGLALDGLDDHDTGVVVDGLCIALVATDPGAAVRACADAALEDPGKLHDAEGVWAAYLLAAAILQI